MTNPVSVQLAGADQGPAPRFVIQPAAADEQARPFFRIEAAHETTQVVVAHEGDLAPVTLQVTQTIEPVSFSITPISEIISALTAGQQLPGAGIWKVENHMATTRGNEFGLPDFGRVLLAWKNGVLQPDATFEVNGQSILTATFPNPFATGDILTFFGYAQTAPGGSGTSQVN